jgi:hypothetical protein
MSLAYSPMAKSENTLMWELTRKYPCLCFTEARGSTFDQNQWTAHFNPTHQRYMSGGRSGIASGIMFVVERAFLHRHRVTVEHESIIDGRVGAIILTSPDGPPCYFLGIHNHGLTRADIATVKAATLRLSNLVSLAVPLPGIGIILCGFNYTLRDGCRWGNAPGRSMECSPPS